ncbi:MAG TPA: zf-HC2 domain-containing protein [Solirubrobacteraceae bacterium]|nr:zf-HC2 domain-containing protein [Solirubrobacteraceae bacterium]
MTCRELVELVTEYLEDALPVGQRARFEEHVGRCAGCRAYLAQMRATVELVGRLREEDVPEDLLAAFRNWHAGSPG